MYLYYCIEGQSKQAFMAHTHPTGEGTYIWKGYKKLDKKVKFI